MSPAEEPLAACLRLLEETGDVERCLQIYPDQAEALKRHLATVAELSMLGPSGPAAAPMARSRHLLLSSMTQNTGGRGMLLRMLSGKAAGALAALALAAVGTVGVSATSGGVNQAGPVNDVLSSVGVVDRAQPAPGDDNHGANVSNEVHDAQQSATPGAGLGLTACEAARDRSTLPTPAQNAPGLQGANSPDCSQIGDDHADVATATPTPSISAATTNSTTENEGTPGTQATTPDNHGQSVSSAVHDAIASTTPGPGRGEAVSEAACTAAHDRSTLPSGAQDAHGGDAKDCVHPNADGTPGNGNNGNNGQSGLTAQATPIPGISGQSGNNRPSSLPGNAGQANPQGSNQNPGNAGQGSGRPATLPNVPAHPAGAGGQGHRP